ncbi:MAG: hypothetical protein R3D00_22975 [Bacteroidia bacterium]
METKYKQQTVKMPEVLSFFHNKYSLCANLTDAGSFNKKAKKITCL